MNRASRSRLASSLVALGLLLGTTVPAPGQSGVPASVLASSRDPSVIKTQLRLAVQLGGEVLADLRAAPSDDSVPIDPKLLRKARDTYALIRAGRHGFELIKEWNEGRKGVLPDPIMDLAFKRVDNAWNLSRTPVDLSSSLGISRQEYLRRATEDLGRALQLVNQALAIML
jgi:hypothetical protein